MGLAQAEEGDNCLHEFFRKKPIVCVLHWVSSHHLLAVAPELAVLTWRSTVQRGRLVLFLWSSLLWLLVIVPLPSSEVKGGLWCVWCSSASCRQKRKGEEQRTLGRRWFWALLILPCLRSLSMGRLLELETRAYTNQPPCEPGVLLRKWGQL